MEHSVTEYEYGVQRFNTSITVHENGEEDKCITSELYVCIWYWHDTKTYEVKICNKDEEEVFCCTSWSKERIERKYKKFLSQYYITEMLSKIN